MDIDKPLKTNCLELRDLIKLWDMIQAIDDILSNCKFDLDNCICQPKATDLMELKQVMYNLARLKEVK